MGMSTDCLERYVRLVDRSGVVGRVGLRWMRGVGEELWRHSKFCELKVD
jgi:hypothetical protein